jgi:hypothetical protein
VQLYWNIHALHYTFLQYIVLGTGVQVQVLSLKNKFQIFVPGTDGSSPGFLRANKRGIGYEVVIVVGLGRTFLHSANFR